MTYRRDFISGPTFIMNVAPTRVICKVRGLWQCAAVMQREAVIVMPSCSGGDNIVVT
jgi:hypothetical protein